MADISYTPTTWADGAEGGTPIDAAKLNNIEQGIVDAVAAIGPNDTTADGTLKAQIDALGDSVTPKSYTPVWASGDTPRLSSCVVVCGICHFSFQGAVVAHSNNDIVCNLPVGCRPANDVTVPFVKNSDSYGTLLIASSGAVSVLFISSTTSTSRISVNASYPV